MTERSNDYLFWSKTADHFDAATVSVVGVRAQEGAKTWLRDQLAATDAALEIGCGTGCFSSVIAERVLHLTAIDMSKEMLARAKERLQACLNVDVLSADGYQTGFSGQSFDVVFMGNVVHIVQEPETVLREAYRLLKPAGRLLLVDYTLRGMCETAKQEMAKRYISQFGPPPLSNKNYWLDELAALVQSLNFEIREAQVIEREINVLCLRAVKN